LSIFQNIDEPLGMRNVVGVLERGWY